MSNWAATFPEVLDRAAAASAAGVGIELPDEQMTWPEFADRTFVLAQRLLGAGVARGDRVGLVFNSAVDSYGLLIACQRVGAIPVPINVRFKAREFEYVIAKAGMKLVICDPMWADALLEPGIAGASRVVIGSNDPVFAVGGEGHTAEEVRAIQAQLGPDDDALMLFTSGTTANPKGCVHRHLALVAEGALFAERLRLTPTDRFWTPLPFFHVGGSDVLAAAMSAHCATIQMPHFDATLALEQLANGVTVAFSAFETIWLAVLGHEKFATTDLSALRLVINVAVPPSLRAMQERLPTAAQISCFGSTETTGFACVGEAEDSIMERSETSGKPLPGIEVTVFDPETGKECAPGEPGELVVRGPTRFMYYWDEPEITAETIDADGWYHSGDLGRKDADGRISFVGRLKDMLKVGGENVAAAEVESYLVQHPAVEIVQIVAAPDARYVEVAAAFVQLRPGASVTEQELIDFCRGEIATFKVPRYVRFVAEWPMSGTKIQKFRLRQQIADELAAAGITEAPKITSK